MSARIKINAPDLRRLITEGLSTAEIAERFGVKPPAVTRACHTYGLSLPHGKRKPGGWSAPEPTRDDDERDLSIIRRVVAGQGINATADRFGISNVTVQRLVQQVEAADLAESGEPVMSVARHYAFPRRRRS